ncbi:MAG: OmpA family protein [Pseudomonadaceae bacterium]|nr:OmpA family protein [Pseudomonadaceae bacterium]
MPLLLNKRLFFASLVVASSITLAQAQPATGFTLAPSVGYYNFDSDRGVKDEVAYSLGLGYQFSNPWAVEFVYLNANSENKATRADIDVDQFRVDALYHLTSGSKLTPYLAAGVGIIDFSAGPNNAIVNAGVGVKYAFNDLVSLRGDFRLIDDVEDSEIDTVTTLGLHFLFGTKATPVTKPAPVEAAPLVIVAVDTDNDGVVDANDRCPNTPAGVQVDAQGCALDDDQDGVPNYLDACPDSAAGAKVDAKGCYLVLEAIKTVSLDVHFATNSAVVDTKYYPQIEEVAAFLKEYPEALIVIEGHTDNAGAASYNKSLSEKRAQAIAKVLTQELGVKANRVTAIGYGEEKPLVGNDTAEQRKANRRVVTVISAD